jgi:hypothetical protein
MEQGLMVKMVEAEAEQEALHQQAYLLLIGKVAQDILLI